MQFNKRKSFLKWAGGKIRLLNEISSILPYGKRLIEPFVGSCSVSLNLDYNEYLLGDANKDLINLFQWIQNDGESIIRISETYFTEDNLSENNFYKYREKFNKTKSDRIKAILFIYLNRHAFNGMCRYNSKSEYNIPCGNYKKTYFPKKEMLSFMEWSRKKKVTFLHADFREIMKMAQEGDVIYADPPYSPLSETSNFASYVAKKFDEQDHKDLVQLAYNSKVPVVISNHNTSFTRELYKNAMETKNITVQRMISGSNKRGKANELLSLFSPDKKLVEKKAKWIKYNVDWIEN